MVSKIWYFISLLLLYFILIFFLISSTFDLLFLSFSFLIFFQKRYWNDREINHRMFSVLRNGEFKDLENKNIRVGDIINVVEDQVRTHVYQ